MALNPFRVFFDDATKHRLIDKWNHYFDIYDRHFRPIRDQARKEKRKVQILEIGIYQGGSLQMWNNYFGGPDNVNIYAIDIDPNTKNNVADPNITVFIGDQANRQFLRKLLTDIPHPLDIIIDDGGHMMHQQIISFEELYPKVGINGGVYLCEDLHTSYFPEYDGGFKRPGTFIEYAKNLIDSLNAFHSRESKVLTPNDFTWSTDSITFYDSVVIFTRTQREKPSACKSGK